jgi:hypothetical protein
VVSVTDDLIEQYLAELQASLRTPPGETVRILAEAEAELGRRDVQFDDRDDLAIIGQVPGHPHRRRVLTAEALRQPASRNC